MTSRTFAQLQELRGNIRVFARVRQDAHIKCCLKFPDDETIVAPGSHKEYKFDKVFKPNSKQEDVRSIEW